MTVIVIVLASQWKTFNYSNSSWFNIFFQIKYSIICCNTVAICVHNVKASIPKNKRCLVNDGTPKGITVGEGTIKA